MSLWRKSLVFAIVLILSGCGYTLKHRLKDSFVNAQGIFVPVFDNFTDETGAERYFTNALIRELQAHSETILPSRRPDGLELQGSIKKIDIVPTAFTEVNAPNSGMQPYKRIPSEIGVGVVFNLKLIDTKTQRQLWTKDYSGFRRVAAPTTRTFDYQAPSSVGMTTQSNVEQIYPDMARDVMRDVYDEMVEFF